MQDLSTWRVFADCKNSASECNESSLSNCRAQPILSKSLYSSSADDISAGTGQQARIPVSFICCEPPQLIICVADDGDGRALIRLMCNGHQPVSMVVCICEGFRVGSLACGGMSII